MYVHNFIKIPIQQLWTNTKKWSSKQKCDKKIKITHNNEFVFYNTVTNNGPNNASNMHNYVSNYMFVWQTIIEILLKKGLNNCKKKISRIRLKQSINSSKIIFYFSLL